MEMKFEKNSFGKRLSSMLTVDFRRMFTMPLFYIMLGTSFAIPVLVLVMTTMMDGSVTVDPQTGVETVIEGFDSAWQAIGAIGESSGTMDMSLTAMCNINMMFFLVAVLICLFVAADFRSGYAKNLFTVRAKKTDYVISKTLVCYIGGVAMLLAFFVGSLLGGVIAGVPFDMGFATTGSIVMCMLAKSLLMLVFVGLYLLMSVIAKQKVWLSMILSFMVGMFLFMMVPIVSPLNSTIMNVVLCLAGGVLFSAGMGAVSNWVLKKKDILYWRVKSLHHLRSQ